MGQQNTYYPSFVVKIKLRFDDKLYSTITDPDAGTQASQSGENSVPLVMATGPNSETFIENIVPVKASVEFHGYRQAATWDLTLNYRQLPIDPRLVRSAAVEIYSACIHPDNFAAGAGEGNRWSDGHLRSQVETRPVGGYNNTLDLVIVGPVDEWTVDHSTSGGEVVLKGRDLRGLLLDAPLVSQNDTRRSHVLDRIDITKPINRVVEQLLHEHGRLRDLHVVVDRNEWPKGVIPSPTTAARLPRHRRGARGQSASSGMGGDGGLTYWDAITQYCFYVGAVPYFLGTNLYVRPALSLFGIDVRISNRAPTNYPGAHSRQAVADYTFVYGRDLKKMRIARKYAGNNKPKAIRCVSYTTSNRTRGIGQQIEATWPPQTPADRRALVALLRTPTLPGSHATRTAGTTTNVSGNESHLEIENIPVPGVASRDQLLSIAMSIFEQRARGELEGNFEAANLTSFGQDGPTADLLRIRPGHTVELLVNRESTNHGEGVLTALQRVEHLPLEQAVTEIRRYVRDVNLARAIVTSSRGTVMGVLRFWRVAGVKFEWSNQTGISIVVDFHNYIMARQDAVPPGTLRTPRPGQRQPHGPTTANTSDAHRTGTAEPARERR